MEPNSIVLEGAQTIAKAEALHQEIEEQLNNSNRLSIDASDVERADTAVMQVLTSLVNDREVEVEIKASDALKECAHLLGLKTLEAKFQ
jgi:ABC-type transporter Mla MlaB component